ncbi:MAG TPA: Spy/CpxP family protein refolding chaperone [Terriglobia bacterium]|jgi:Spy/CpxP family protein refolding chaperone
MKTRIAAILAAGSLCLAAPTLAQDATPQQNRMQRQAEQIKTVLDLTDRQFNELNDVRTAYNEKVRELSTQIRELEKQRREAMQASGTDPLVVGSIALQVQSLQQQIQEENKAYREHALSVLTASQREKVEDIQEAIKLAQQAGALAAFGLLEGQGGMRGFAGGGPMMMRGGAPPAP